MTSLSRSTAALLLLLLPLQIAAADDSSSSSDDTSTPVQQCEGAINDAFSRERFLYQTMLFGLKKASDEPTGAIRVADDGSVWIKTGADQWANDPTTISNDKMDEQTVKDPLASSSSSSNSSDPSHPGIFESQKATTSDLIPPLLQSFRAYQCRLAAVCEAARKALSTPASDQSSSDESSSDESSSDESSSDANTISIPGCEDIDVAPLTSCQPTPLFTLTDTATLNTYCAPLLTKLTTYDESQLLYLIHYDAASRSLRQFAGYLEPFLRLVHFPIQTPVRQASQFLQNWSRIPCFEPYCSANQPTCKVTIECKDDCGDGALGLSSLGADGNIKVCISNSVNAKEVITHELVHAKQQCQLGNSINGQSFVGTNDGEGFKTRELCCALEHAAYLAQCHIAFDDGLIDSTLYTPEECATAGSNGSCQKYGENACGTAPAGLNAQLDASGMNMDEKGNTCANLKDNAEKEINAELGNNANP